VLFRLGRTHETRIGALEPDEAGVLPRGGAGDDIELQPQAVELALSIRVQQELVERAVIAEVARHAVEAGAEQPAAEFFFLLGVEVNTRTFGDEEGIRKGRAKARECRLVFLGKVGVVRRGEGSRRCRG
jgi:hypothetical protein